MNICLAGRKRLLGEHNTHERHTGEASVEDLGAGRAVSGKF